MRLRGFEAYAAASVGGFHSGAYAIGSVGAAVGPLPPLSGVRWV